MSGYKVAIIVEEGYDERIHTAKNKDEIIEILKHHIACCLGDTVEVEKK